MVRKSISREFAVTSAATRREALRRDECSSTGRGAMVNKGCASQKGEEKGEREKVRMTDDGC